MAFKGIDFSRITVPTQVQYYDLVDGDTLVDKSGNDWRVVEVERVDSDQGVAFWLADTTTGVKAHRMNKPSGEFVTVRRHPSRAEEVEAREAEVDAAEAVVGPDIAEELRQAGADPVATVEEILHGTTLATETADHEAARERADTTGEPMSLPPFEEMTDPEMRSHLYLVHGVYAHDLKTIKSLVKLHAEAHSSVEQHGVTAHNHEGVMP